MKRNKYFVNTIASLVGLIFLSNIFGCSQKVSTKSELTIFVPCSIFASFCEILDLYKKEHPGVRINFDTGNSVVLMRKVLDKNARPDIYIATGPLEFNPLVKRGLIETTVMAPVALANDSVILVTPETNPKNIHTLSDLAREDVKTIALPDPNVNSSGKYAVDILKRLNLWEQIKNKITFTEFGRNSRNYITENKVDAGIMYRSCLYEDLKAYDEVIVPKDFFIVMDLSKTVGDSGVIQSMAGILKSSKNKPLAKEFIEYMKSERSQEILKKWAGKEIKNQ
ncbi:MAG: molybdate ABC transporter substrate-binding protein [Candidatus Omnitrophica bacterium]|nr:molybdate ABC transporter substrate-binding protein [Candidatus Omnitrophota bacterium]